MGIDVVGLKKKFQTKRGVRHVLTGVSFHIEKGAIIALTGRSGTGKTTLLHCMGGLESPDSGRVVCFSHEIQKMKPKERLRFVRENVGFIFQSGNLLSHLTVSENLSFPLKLNRVSKPETTRRVSELLEFIELADARNAMPHELSGGELQRVSLARAIAHKPVVLLADEPTASLDSATGARMVTLIQALTQEHGCTTVFSTHDEEILHVADRVIRLRDGAYVDGE